MEPKLIRCPTCNKGLIEYLGGDNSTYSIRCHNSKCKSNVVVFSAGKTLLQSAFVIYIEYKIKL